MAKSSGDYQNDASSLMESDVTRQAELVVMEYLKSHKCVKTLDAIMTQSKSATTNVYSSSALASELYADDLDKKKQSGAKSVLEYVVARMEIESESGGRKPLLLDSTLSRSASRRSSKDSKDNSTSSTSSSRRSSSSSRRRSSADESSGDKSSPCSSVKWTREEINQLKKAIKLTTAISDKNDRWREIASLVGNGKNKKHCYLKYKELKEERSSSSRTSSGDERSSISSTTGSNSWRSRRRTSSTDDATSDCKSSSVASSVAASEVSSKASTTESKDKSEPNKPHHRLSDGRTDDDEPALMRSAARMASSKQASKAEELQMEDCDDFDTPVVPTSRHRPSSEPSHATTSTCVADTSGRSFTADEIESLRGILFPDERPTFSSHWERQGFSFSDARDLGYGLVQHEGGPCGVLAVVQAYVLRFLLGVVGPSDWRNPTSRDQEHALVLAICHILWQAARASKKPQCVVVLNDGKSSATAFSTASSSTKRKFTNGLQIHTTTTTEQTQALVTRHVRQFMAARGNGLVLLVVSAVLSKGVDTIKHEMDSVEGALGGGGKLIGGHDYCTQEIVNLLLGGVACSNVFNGKQLLEGTSDEDPNAVVLKGFSARCTVGFLSLFEAYEYLLVGSYLKNPQFNIWVVCSESHYSVLFADPKLLTSDGIHDKLPKLDVFYFDGLGNQDEEIRLTVHAFAMEEKQKPHPDDLTPPLNLVLQTKWPLARIDWNGVDPLL